ncbi:MAG: SDR family NAD(P)-dependent oxidoreductase [Oceanospirillaceae bacterium]|nr:SDR family NAD(P)-dependent oxidoreductase [Oceanospirillaceae bacterium]MCP5335285.1 SDR family NAD(P)-dependent oxidoreductase [Oceanospirillaceae bacterium]MCP5350762.1 SDR family NAD(P)-dependent oxidoreductase [Oceanospirillaceae bacterium]
MQIEHKNIVLTGAASGIGKAILEQLVKLEGVRIVAADLHAFSCEHNQVAVFSGDISQSATVDALLDFAVQTMGSVDIFIANAGFAYYEQTQQANWQHIDNIYRCNTYSPIYSAHKMAELNRGRPYSVLITASFMGIYSLPGYSLYSSTKAALLSWADAYRMEKNDLGYIAMLCPVATKTHFFNTKAPVPWPTQTAEQVASAALQGLRQNKNRIYPSKLSVLTLFLNWICPLTMPVYKAIELAKFKKWLQNS